MLVAVLLACVAARPARAQEEDRLRITRQEFEQHAQTLDLAPPQRDAAEKMVADWAREYDDARRMRWDMDRWLTSNTPGSYGWYGGKSTTEFASLTGQEYGVLDRQWQVGARALEAAYFARLMGIAIGQEEQVEALRRKHMRDRALPDLDRYGPTGASTNLLEMLGRVDAGLLSSAGLQPVLHEYEIALDKALREFDEAQITWHERIETARAALDAAQAAGAPTAHLETVYMDAAGEMSVRCMEIRHLHEATAQRVAPLLSPSAQGRLDDEMFLAMHRYLRQDAKPSITPEEAFAKALGRNDVTAEKKGRLEQLQARYRVARRQAAPALESAFFARFGPETNREQRLMMRHGQRDELIKRINEADANWSNAQKEWQTQCSKVLGEIDDAFAGHDAGGKAETP